MVNEVPKVLKHFTDVIPMPRGHYKYKTEYLRPVPPDIIELWESRGYFPSETGLAHVTYQQTPGKIYDYPAYFWSN